MESLRYSDSTSHKKLATKKQGKQPQRKNDIDQDIPRTGPVSLQSLHGRCF